MSKKIKVVIAGAGGRMGQESVRAVLNETDLELVGVVGHARSANIGQDIGLLVGVGEIGLTLTDNLRDCLQSTQPDVMLDFTVPSVVFQNSLLALECGVRPILGATGLSDEDIQELEKKVLYFDSTALIAPNFAIGVLLMIETAKKVAKYMKTAEIIEIHHDKKVDAPSGTAVKTAKELSKIIEQKQIELSDDMAPRGECIGNVRVHSMRLPGAIAHQEIIFGDIGQMLSIKHDTIHRSAFMPGVILAIRKIMHSKGLIYGLENFLD